MGRIYDRTLECGCMISTDKGGGLMPCYAEYGNMGNEEDARALLLHEKSWRDWENTEDYKKHLKEIKEKNQ